MNRRLLATVVVIVLVGLAGVWWYFSIHTRIVTINSTNVESVMVRDNDREEITKIQGDSNSVRLANGQNYTLDYQAANNYASGSIELADGQSTISISPDYSSAYYRSLISKSLPEVMSLLEDKYPNTDKYSVSDQKMYERGKWLSIVLKHRGSYGTYTDDLRVIFKKDGDNWSIATTPDILLDRYDNPDVPYEILLDTNHL